MGAVSLAYAGWLVYAGGWQYVLIAGLFYLIGTGLFVWARKEGGQPVFTGVVEKILVGIVAAVSVVAVVGLVQGFVSV